MLKPRGQFIKLGFAFQEDLLRKADDPETGTDPDRNNRPHRQAKEPVPSRQQVPSVRYPTRVQRHMEAETDVLAMRQQRGLGKIRTGRHDGHVLMNPASTVRNRKDWLNGWKHNRRPS